MGFEFRAFAHILTQFSTDNDGLSDTNERCVSSLYPGTSYNSGVSGQFVGISKAMKKRYRQSGRALADRGRKAVEHRNCF